MSAANEGSEPSELADWQFVESPNIEVPGGRDI
jgi:hypothetical protein